jgi:hypothetical protein
MNKPRLLYCRNVVWGLRLEIQFLSIRPLSQATPLSLLIQIHYYSRSAEDKVGFGIRIRVAILEGPGTTNHLKTDDCKTCHAKKKKMYF